MSKINLFFIITTSYVFISATESNKLYGNVITCTAVAAG
jgi:hypothetical protein